MSSLPKHAATLPIIGVSTNVRHLPEFTIHGASEKSLQAVYDVAGCLPLMLPALGSRYDFAHVIERLDGLLLTGAASYVDPSYYQGDDDLDPSLKDKERDATTLPLIRMAIEAGLPILALCRGVQELNVALGGTLKSVADKKLHSSEGQDRPLADWLVQHKHPLNVEAGGLLAQLWPETGTAQVNSAHGQVIDKLAPRLRLEATSGDGEIEAVSVAGSTSFALGVQWHPEYTVEQDSLSQNLFTAFGQAARSRLAQRYLQADWDQSVIDEALPGNMNA